MKRNWFMSWIASGIFSADEVLTVDLTLGYSPCPNDTYIFYGIATGRIRPVAGSVRVSFHDVETLNKLAEKACYDVTKLSFYAWLRVKASYRMLSCGGALGYGCGPVLISKRPMSPGEVSSARVVLPGEGTTAHLLFRLWAPEAADRSFVPYDEILGKIQSGEADCGVIIHESRFTFAQSGFHRIVDLGQWWERKTGLPIPLGCIAVRNSFSESQIRKIESAIRESMDFAGSSPPGLIPHIREFAKEMAPEILQKHIETFVNDFSWDLGEEGHRAVKTLESMAIAAGLVQ